MQIEKDGSGNEWATFSAAEIVALLRRELGDRRLAIVRFLHPNGKLLNGWCGVEIMLEKEGPS